jgi:hypothetical protein
MQEIVLRDDNMNYHCETGPAISGPYRDMWFVNGKLHNLHGPAIVRRDESGNVISTEWFRDGRYYREGGLPVVESKNYWGSQILYYAENGKITRDVNFLPHVDERLYTPQGRIYQIRYKSGKVVSC